MNTIKNYWVEIVLVLGCVFVLIGLVRLQQQNAQLTTQVQELKNNIGGLNILGNEIVNTSNNGSMASSTDFLKAVYFASMQIGNQIKAQQSAQQQAVPASATSTP